VGFPRLQAREGVNSRYNLQNKYEERQEWAEEQEEHPHVVAGMYLKSEE
jgi:hypothetical protein